MTLQAVALQPSEAVSHSLLLPMLSSPRSVLVAALTLLWVASLTLRDSQFLWNLVTDVGSPVMMLGTLWLKPHPLWDLTELWFPPTLLDSHWPGIPFWPLKPFMRLSQTGIKEKSLSLHHSARWPSS